jgi:frataxin-like iron-binding protein CyaY
MKKAQKNLPPFADLAAIQLTRIQDCVAGMEAHNAVFDINLESDRLTIEMGEENGNLVIIPDEANEELMMSSPVR